MRCRGAYGVYVKEEDLLIDLSARRINLRNYWSGSWISQWTVGCTSGVLTGTITIHVHYFENGNLQLQTKKSISAKVDVTVSVFLK